ncbi:predicted protein [Postia placenta Mad-698-R]|nr:predicted protein [Postia placenta Mad-698-R]
MAVGGESCEPSRGLQHSDGETDWGKQPESSPPPPYEQGEWVPPKPKPSSVPATPPVQVTPPTPRSRKSRHIAATSYMPIPPEFSCSAPDADPELDTDKGEDDQMSWIGDKLALLIAEGQRALGKEVVVMSEAPEDEEGNGMDNWVEEDGGRAVLAWRPATLLIAARLAPPQRVSTSIPGSPHCRGREVSIESDRFASMSFQEDESAWQTPELWEAMERARQR